MDVCISQNNGEKSDENVGEECRRRLSLGGSWWFGQSYRTPLAVQDGQARKE
jgi:hypothetical protein